MENFHFLLRSSFQFIFYNRKWNFYVSQPLESLREAISGLTDCFKTILSGPFSFPSAFSVCLPLLACLFRQCSGQLWSTWKGRMDALKNGFSYQVNIQNNLTITEMCWRTAPRAGLEEWWLDQGTLHRTNNKHTSKQLTFISLVALEVAVLLWS